MLRGLGEQGESLAEQPFVTLNFEPREVPFQNINSLK